MTLIRGREFLMGSNDHYPEEAPVRRATVGDFWIDQRPVTNAEFADFVAETGYVTFAEIPPDPRDYPGMDPAMARPGSAVFTPTPGPVDLSRPDQWWSFVFGANWRHPLGPDSTIDDIMDHPVVQIAHGDAQAYAAWTGKSLPSEAEWEFAARGGLEGAAFAWGDELTPGGQVMANYWQGRFPYETAAADRYQRTSPVGAFPPNGYGLSDMIGNVWEWTSDWYNDATAEPGKACCGPPRARRGVEAESYDPGTPNVRIPRRVMKGGSHLCAPSYCQRYRPAARYAQPIDSPTSHTGFRCVARRSGDATSSPSHPQS
ncbi:MAG: formylglycine-generating enzyme family protein [Proteobacteria bacterium]|nr:formylglycine-generating enzyme family protein [Pseudomonadota bacterium]